MRQKFVFVTAMAVCLTLAAVPALANERTIDRHGDRTKAGKGTSAKGAVTIEYSDDEIAVFSIVTATFALVPLPAFVRYRGPRFQPGVQPAVRVHALRDMPFAAFRQHDRRPDRGWRAKTPLRTT